MKYMYRQLKLGDSSFNIDAIGFNLGEQVGNYMVSDILDSVFSLEINIWNGSRKVQMVLTQKSKKSPTSKPPYSL